jgi:hypothetical protein
MAGGCGGCAPFTPTEVSLFEKGRPAPTLALKRGWRGRSPLPGGLGDVPPKAKNRGRVAHLSNPATSGAQNPGEPKARGGGQKGVQGGEAPWPWQPPNQFPHLGGLHCIFTPECQALRPQKLCAGLQNHQLNLSAPHSQKALSSLGPLP